MDSDDLIWNCFYLLLLLVTHRISYSDANGPWLCYEKRYWRIPKIIKWEIIYTTYWKITYPRNKYCRGWSNRYCVNCWRITWSWYYLLSNKFKAAVKKCCKQWINIFRIRYFRVNIKILLGLQIIQTKPSTSLQYLQSLCYEIRSSLPIYF